LTAPYKWEADVPKKENYTIFLTENSKGNPYCAENFIGKKASLYTTAPRRARKNKLYPIRTEKRN
jgi:hypothetical protein